MYRFTRKIVALIIEFSQRIAQDNLDFIGRINALLSPNQIVIIWSQKFPENAMLKSWPGRQGYLFPSFRVA